MYWTSHVQEPLLRNKEQLCEIVGQKYWRDVGGEKGGEERK